MSDHKTPITVTAPNGCYTRVVARDSEEGRAHEEAVKHPSSTELQPYIGLNYRADGSTVGGSTMSQVNLDNLLELAVDKGLVIS